MSSSPISTGRPLGSTKSSKVWGVDPVEYTAGVLDTIQKCRATKCGDFKSDHELIFGDPPLLLLILLNAYAPNCRMNLRDCGEYLLHRQQFWDRLNDAYAKQEFAKLLEDHEMPLQQAPTPQSGMTPAFSGPNLQSAFEVPYLGNMARLFVRTLNMERASRAGAPAAYRPYNWSIAVVQSSGMGKSRMVDEAGKFVFTIPFNIREQLDPHKKTYPPPDVAVRDFFESCKHDSDELQQKKYAIFLQILFARTLTEYKSRFIGVSGGSEKLANAWAAYLKEGQTENTVGINRKIFYESVVAEAQKAIERNTRRLESLLTAMDMSCKYLLELIQPTKLPQENACFVYFDEAHSLTKSIGNPTEGHKSSPYRNLSKVLSELDQRRVFFIFLSTDSGIQGFAPPPSSHPSERMTVGGYLIPPFIETPFDLHEHEKLRDAMPLTLDNVCKTKVMIGFGRPLWYAQHKIKPHENIFQLAGDKLAASGLENYKSTSILAALGIRVGITFDTTQQAAYSTQSKLVESHLRVVYSIPRDREYMHTGSPSEPVLAEAASRYLNGSRCRGIAIEGPERFALELEKGLLVRGEPGELAGRLLLTSAHDLALARNLCLDDPEPLYHRPILVEDFLCALFNPDYHDLILDARPVIAEGATETLRTAFSDSYISFSHFALAEDTAMLSSPALATALVRGMAIQARDNQASIHAVIPIHKAPRTSPISSKTTSAINLQFKNRKSAVDLYVNRSISVSDLEMPVISIIFEFGVTDIPSPPISITAKPRITSNMKSPDQDERHYQIVAFGCSSAVFRPINSTTIERQYKTILGSGAFLENFPRNCDEENRKALLGMKPVFEGEEQIRTYSELWNAKMESDTVDE